MRISCFPVSSRLSIYISEQIKRGKTTSVEMSFIMLMRTNTHKYTYVCKKPSISSNRAGSDSNLFV